LKAAGPSLLETVRGLLERTYRMETDLGDLGTFVIGDEGYRRFYAGKQLHYRAASTPGLGAQLLVRELGSELLVCIYFPDDLIRRLESHPPQRGLDESNIDAFSIFVEEIDHFLLLAERAALGRSLTLFEMELHANVSKYLVLSRFLAGAQQVLDPLRRIWLRHHLFEKGRFDEDDAGLRRRYSDARRWGVKFLDALLTRGAPERIDSLRRFHDADAREKLLLIQSAA
jgi:hypothetical protein